MLGLLMKAFLSIGMVSLGDVMWGGLMELVILVPLVWVRKIQKFAMFHVFGDLTIAVTIVIIVVFASLYLESDERPKHPEFVPLNENTFLSILGMSIYAYEGIGIVIPVMEIASDQRNFPKVVFGVLTTLGVVYIFFGLFNYYSFQGNIL